MQAVLPEKILLGLDINRKIKCRVPEYLTIPEILSMIPTGPFFPYLSIFYMWSF